MELEKGQFRIRDLLLGKGTDYTVRAGFDAWSLDVDASQTGSRAWGHGSWSGAEWNGETVMSIPVSIKGNKRWDSDGWMEKQKLLTHAFRAVGDSGEEVELRWRIGSSEYVRFGRPRGVRYNAEHLANGMGQAVCGFVSLDPRIYDGELDEITSGLPQQEGGLVLPTTVPFVIDGRLIDGRFELTNHGTAETALVMRIEGPINQPRVTLQQPEGNQVVQFNLELLAGQWLDVDTSSRTALLNGLPQSSQRGRSVWDMEAYPLIPGTTVVRFDAQSYIPEAQLTVWHRSAWW